MWTCVSVIHHLPCLCRRDLYQKVNNFVLLNLCIALICGLITFCAGIETAAWHVVRFIHLYSTIYYTHNMYMMHGVICKNLIVWFSFFLVMIKMQCINNFDFQFCVKYSLLFIIVLEYWFNNRLYIILLRIVNKLDAIYIHRNCPKISNPFALWLLYEQTKNNDQQETHSID